MLLLLFSRCIIIITMNNFINIRKLNINLEWKNNYNISYSLVNILFNRNEKQQICLRYALYINKKNRSTRFTPLFQRLLFLRLNWPRVSSLRGFYLYESKVCESLPSLKNIRQRKNSARSSGWKKLWISLKLQQPQKFFEGR